MTVRVSPIVQVLAGLALAAFVADRIGWMLGLRPGRPEQTVFYTYQGAPGDGWRVASVHPIGIEERATFRLVALMEAPGGKEQQMVLLEPANPAQVKQLQQQLAGGWRVVSLTGAGGTDTGAGYGAIFVLER